MKCIRMIGEKEIIRVTDEAAQKFDKFKRIEFVPKSEWKKQVRKEVEKVVEKVEEKTEKKKKEKKKKDK